nr:hypothetical protein [Tanacetum cinerariifolium]
MYAAGSVSRPPMLNKENYVPWSSRLLRRMIHEPGDVNRDVNVTKTFHLQTDDKLSDKELKQIKVDDQAIQTILLGLPEDIYAAVDSCETAQEIWLRVQQMMKGSDIGIQEKKAKLFNEWERFTSNEGESIESYYHHFLKLMNDLKRNKHFLEKIASNLKFLNNLQPEISQWRYNLTPTKSKFKTPMLDHQDKYTMKAQNVRLVKLCTPWTIVVLMGVSGTRSFVILIKHPTCLNDLLRIVLHVETRLMVIIVKDMLFYESNLRKICLHIVLTMEFSKILPSHPMTISTLLMLFKSHSLSNKTPVKIPHKVLHKSTTIVVTDVVIR